MLSVSKMAHKQVGWVLMKLFVIIDQASTIDYLLKSTPFRMATTANQH